MQSNLINVYVSVRYMLGQFFRSTSSSTRLSCHPCHPVITNKGMTVAAFAELVVGDWPLLKHLCLSSTFVDENKAVTMPLNCTQHLVQGQWPSLERLELSNCLISVDALRVLVMGQWPSLCYLDLSCNLLDEESFATLRGKSGQQIKQCVNILKPTQLLADGFWPKLSYIDLSPGAHE